MHTALLCWNLRFSFLTFLSLFAVSSSSFDWHGRGSRPLQAEVHNVWNLTSLQEVEGGAGIAKFCGAGHGKGLWDGLGAMVKSLIRKLELMKDEKGNPLFYAESQMHIFRVLKENEAL